MTNFRAQIAKPALQAFKSEHHQHIARDITVLHRLATRLDKGLSREAIEAEYHKILDTTFSGATIIEYVLTIVNGECTRFVRAHKRSEPLGETIAKVQ